MFNWVSFLKQVSRDIKLWFSLVFFFFINRAFMMFYFSENIVESDMVSDILLSFFNGFRYDSMVSTYMVIIPLFFSVYAGFSPSSKTPDRVRIFFAAISIAMSTLMFCVSFEYFIEYNDVFNHFIFGLYYDDTKAILITVWKEYHLLRYIIFSIFAFIAVYKATIMFINAGNKPIEIAASKIKTHFHKAMLVLFIFLSVFFASRGSLGPRPMQSYDTEITKSWFLNKMTLNPYMALKYAFQSYRKYFSSVGLENYLGNMSIESALQYSYGYDIKSTQISQYFEKQAEGTHSSNARHIFVVILESFDSWPLLPKYRPLGLMDGFQRLAEDGFYVKDFLPSSPGSMASLSSIISGLPSVGAPINYMYTKREPLPTSIASIFKRLGYKTNFYYGGNLQWKRLRDFASEQGFDNVYGTQHMNESPVFNEWGVRDEYLYDFITKNTSDETSTFNLILTTSNHPPYGAPIYEKGFHLNEIPAEFEEIHTSRNTEIKHLGHTWYSDQSIEAFVKSIEQKWPDSIFALTGDHFGRRHLSSNPGIYESTSVPLLLYGKKALEGISFPEKTAGTHLDIAPTIIELVAPQGFTYHTMGKNLLTPQNYPLGYSSGKIIAPGFIVDINSMNVELTDDENDLAMYDLPNIKRLHDLSSAIALWQIMCGQTTDTSKCR